jgi:phosphate transport system substrate-binding protein
VFMWCSASKPNTPVSLKGAGATAPYLRSDASGSTYAFTDYLSQISEMWKRGIGRGGTVPWPVGEAAAGNPALAELVKKTQNSIGYVELNYAIQEGLSYGHVRNAEGKFEKPDFRAMGAAAHAVENMKTDFRASIANSPARIQFAP